MRRHPLCSLVQHSRPAALHHLRSCSPLPAHALPLSSRDLEARESAAVRRPEQRDEWCPRTWLPARVRCAGAVCPTGARWPLCSRRRSPSPSNPLPPPLPFAARTHIRTQHPAVTRLSPALLPPQSPPPPGGSTAPSVCGRESVEPPRRATPHPPIPRLCAAGPTPSSPPRPGPSPGGQPPPPPPSARLTPVRRNAPTAKNARAHTDKRTQRHQHATNTHLSLHAPRAYSAASAGGGEGMETEGPAVGSKRGRSESRAATRRDSSLMARSRSPSNMGLKDEAQVVKAAKLAKKKQFTINKMGLASESDRRIASKRPKHLFSGKRGSGKTDRR
mmetsp:Transcript_44075/g.122135  ORF Transcript_44075/g.122135 Transcript_44075/m.122135 type:complete len:332 (+) Transcript_44075:289-1284(+)